MTDVLVRHLDGDRFAVEVRGHTVVVDQPTTDGGTDAGMSPTELFVAGLVSCVAHYARRYLVRHDLSTDGLAVSGAFTFASRPARVGEVRIEVRLPDGVPEERREALLAVASHCTVHNSLVEPPEVTVALSPAVV